MNAPDWLTRRGGALKQGSDQRTWYVLFGVKPHYSVTPLPAEGKYTARVRQTENGKRVGKDGVFDTQEAALRGGLEELGRELGWL